LKNIFKMAKDPAVLFYFQDFLVGTYFHLKKIIIFVMNCSINSMKNKIKILK